MFWPVCRRLGIKQLDVLIGDGPAGRRLAEALSKPYAAPDLPDEPLFPELVFVCGGDCPKGGDHSWDGDEVRTETMCSVTCSKCGLARIDYDMLRAE